MPQTMTLRGWRGKRSQKEAAGLLGITQGQYSRVESGAAKPSRELAQTIRFVTRGRVRIDLEGLNTRRTKSASAA